MYWDGLVSICTLLSATIWQAARQASPQTRLDINAENKSHLVHDTKYSSKAARAAATATAATTTAHELI